MSIRLGSLLLGCCLGQSVVAKDVSMPPSAAESGADTLAVQVGADCQLSVEIRRDEAPACWHWQCGTDPKQPLGCDLTAMHQVTELSLAPDAQSLAVMSVGEGHPILEWVALPPLREKGQYQVLCTQNPYPGTIWIKAWQGGGLQIGSDVDLRIDGAEARIDVSASSDFLFHWRASDCQLRDLAEDNES